MNKTVEQIAQEIGIPSSVNDAIHSYVQNLYNNSVKFKTSNWIHSNKMDVTEFHLPFESLLIECSEFGSPVTVIENPLPFGNKSDGELTNLKDLFILFDDKRLLVTLWDSGEIEVLNGKDMLNQFETDGTVAKIKEEKENYILVYNILSTIDYINNADYVTTTKREKKTNKYSGRREYTFNTTIKLKRNQSSNHGTGTGVKHKYRYRVRGHWRTIESGKRVWVKNHVRGGDGTLFIPKEYEM